jgi:type VI secretion system protein ImpM
MTQDGTAPGFFGKLPARGDFLVRRVPAGLRENWEDWLAGLVVAAREALGTDWPDAWLTAPLWHFSLGRDLAPPLGAMGVVLASVDRVGRFFPFSVVGAASARVGLGRDAWARSAEDLALAALDDDFDPDALDRALAGLGPPSAAAGAARAIGHWPLHIAGDWPAPAGDAFADSALQPPGPAQSVWWCRGSERMPPAHLRCDGLPDAAASAALVTGAFSGARG